MSINESKSVLYQNSYRLSLQFKKSAVTIYLVSVFAPPLFLYFISDASASWIHYFIASGCGQLLALLCISSVYLHQKKQFQKSMKKSFLKIEHTLKEEKLMRGMTLKERETLIQEERRKLRCERRMRRKAYLAKKNKAHTS